MNEPTITINGTTLTEVQAMTFRVAITSFDWDLDDDKLGDLGAAGPIYKKSAGEILTLILKGMGIEC